VSLPSIANPHVALGYLAIMHKCVCVFERVKALPELMRVSSSGSLWFSYKLDACLSGWAHLKCLGLPENVSLEGLSDSDQRSLAGEAFALPCIGQAMIAFYCNPWGPWWQGNSCPSLSGVAV
jgi:hypothetical protein